MRPEGFAYCRRHGIASRGYLGSDARLWLNVPDAWLMVHRLPCKGGRTGPSQALQRRAGVTPELRFEL